MGFVRSACARRNSGEPSPDLRAKYTQDGEPRQRQVENPSAHAMENPTLKSGVFLAEAEGFEPPWACTQTVFKTASL